jgi:hypothetical protein
MSPSVCSCCDPRFTSLRVCPIYWETNRVTVQHLINYPAALIQSRLKHNTPGLPANINKFNLFKSRTGGLLGIIQSVQCNRRTVLKQLPMKWQQQGNLGVYWQTNSKTKWQFSHLWLPEKQNTRTSYWSGVPVSKQVMSLKITSPLYAYCKNVYYSSHCVRRNQLKTQNDKIL